MAKADVTKAYVDTITYKKYESRTSDETEFESLKDIYCVYLNQSTEAVPDKKFTHGLALLVAHHYALDDTQTPDQGGPDTSVGNITTERVGSLTQVRGLQPYIGTLEAWKSFLMQTRYGVEFLYLMNTFKPTPLVL
jgi:hypothetical protein